MNSQNMLTLEQRKAMFRRSKRASVKLPKVPSRVKLAPASGLLLKEGDTEGNSIRIAISGEHGLFDDDVRALKRAETSVDNDAKTPAASSESARHQATEATLGNSSSRRPGSSGRKKQQGVKTARGTISAAAAAAAAAVKVNNMAPPLQLATRHHSKSTTGKAPPGIDDNMSKPRSSLKRTISDAVEGLILTDLREISYDFCPVSDVPIAVTHGSAPQLNFSMSLDQRVNDKIERTYSLISVLAKAFQGFDNALRLVLDNIHILGDHVLVKSLAVATKLALCHAKSAARSSSSSSRESGSTSRVRKNAVSLSAETKRIRALAEIALWRAAELQDILLVFSAEHMVAQTERLVASAPPKLAGVTPLRNALEAAQRCCERFLVELLATKLPKYVATEMEWTSSLDIAAKQLNPAQLQCLPNLRWSKSTQTFITAQAKSGRRCLALAQAAMEMVAVEKASLLDRMRRDEAFRTRAKDGKTAMRAMDRAIIFHVSYEKETGRDRAYSAVDFGLATLVETCKIVQEQLQLIFEARQTGMEFARPFQASIGDCVRKGIEDLSKRLQTQLDTHSEKTLIADMWDLDTDLHMLRRVVEGSISLCRTVADVREEIADGQALCQQAPAFGDEPVIANVLKRGTRMVTRILDAAKNPERYASVALADEATTEMLDMARELRSLLDELPGKIYDTKVNFRKRATILLKQARGQLKWIHKLTNNDRHGRDVVRLLPSIEVTTAECSTRADQVERLIEAMDRDDPAQLGRVWALANDNCIEATTLRKELQKEIEIEITRKAKRKVAREEKMKERAEARRAEVARFRAALPELQNILEQSTKIEGKAKDALKKLPLLQEREGMINALAVFQEHYGEAASQLAAFVPEEAPTKEFERMSSAVRRAREDALNAKKQIGIEVELMSREKSKSFDEAKERTEAAELEAWKRVFEARQKLDSVEAQAQTEMDAAQAAVVEAKTNNQHALADFVEMQMVDIGRSQEEYEEKLTELLKVPIGDPELKKLPELMQKVVHRNAELNAASDRNAKTVKIWEPKLERHRKRFTRLEAEARKATADHIDVIFDEIDEDGSGDLTMNELLPFLTGRHVGLSKKSAIRTVRKVDVNGDGVVDRFEFRAIMVNWISRKKYQSLAEEGFELPDEQDVRDAQTKENAQQPLGDGDTPTTENADSAK